jgi:hypothetical protein
MRVSILVASALGAAVYAAPVYPDLNLNAALPGQLQVISEYFNMLAQKVQANRYMSIAPMCDLSRAQMPIRQSPSTPIESNPGKFEIHQLTRHSSSYTFASCIKGSRA